MHLKAGEVDLGVRGAAPRSGLRRHTPPPPPPLQLPRCLPRPSTCPHQPLPALLAPSAGPHRRQSWRSSTPTAWCSAPIRARPRVRYPCSFCRFRFRRRLRRRCRRHRHRLRRHRRPPSLLLLPLPSSPPPPLPPSAPPPPITTPCPSPPLTILAPPLPSPVPRPPCRRCFRHLFLSIATQARTWPTACRTS